MDTNWANLLRRGWSWHSLSKGQDRVEVNPAAGLLPVGRREYEQNCERGQLRLYPMHGYPPQGASKCPHGNGGNRF